MQSSSKRKGTMLLVTGMILCVVSAGVAMAATGNAPAGSIGSVAETIQSSFGNLAKVLTAGAYVMGIGFVIASLFKFKAHKDNPTQVQIGAPIALLFIGAAMIFIPSVMKTGGATVFGSNASTGGVSGISTISGA
jgi:intracellular multiplication protein IcmD